MLKLILVIFASLPVDLIGGWAVEGALRLKRGSAKE